MYGSIKQHLQNELDSIESAGLFKRERIITSEQGTNQRRHTLTLDKSVSVARPPACV
jgi:hypothetical protein